jgi:hypothetical protein
MGQFLLFFLDFFGLVGCDSPLRIVGIGRYEAFSCSEEKRDTPNSRKSNYCIYDTAEKRGLTSAYPGDDIKSEKTDTTPVKSADDRNEQCDSIHYHDQRSSFERQFNVQE